MTMQVAKDKLLHDFSQVVSDTEELLKSVASAGGEKAQALRASLEQNLKASRKQLRLLEEDALERTRVAARATDKYVHVHPWESIGIAAAVGAFAGVLVGLLIGRR